MKIGIDIDDTITDTYEVMFNYAQKYTIEELNRDGNLKSRDGLNHLYIEGWHNWSEKEAENFWTKYYVDMLKIIKPKFFAIEYIKELSKTNEIYLITARFDDESGIAEKTTLEWLKKYDLPYNKLILKAEDKLEVAKEIGIDVFIDDSFKNCKKVSDGGIKTFMMESMVNKNLDISNENFTRVYSWPHLYQEINLKR